jgi:hypothetical protein
MKYIYLIVSLCFFSKFYAQSMKFEPKISADSILFYFNNSYDVQTSSVNNELSSKIFRGGQINDQLKDENFDKHKELNRIGQEIRSELIFTNLKSDFFKNKNYSWIYNMGYNSIFSSNYSKDFVSLAMYGNSKTLGDSMSFNGSKFQNTNFQYFGAGIQDKKTRSYLTLNVVNLQNHFSANLDGDFYSSLDSTNLYINAIGDLSSTYRSKVSNEIGASINFCLNVEIPIFHNKNALFQLKVSDFGFARINSLSSFAIDTSLSFNGFEVSDLFRLNNSNLNNKNWMDTLNIKVDTASRWISLPVMLQFSKVLTNDSLSKIQTFFGLRAYPTLSYFPKFFGGVDFKLAKSFYSGVTLSYGGFGGFRAGTYIRIHTKHLFFNLGSEDVYGLVSKKGFGRNINLSLICNF